MNLLGVNASHDRNRLSPLRNVMRIIERYGEGGGGARPRRANVDMSQF